MNDSQPNPMPVSASLELNESGAPHSKLTTLLSTDKRIQLLEIAIVFSPAVIAIIAYRVLKIENPMQMIAAVWIANIVMLGLVWLGVRLRGDSGNSIGLPIERTSVSRVLWTILKSILILILAVSAFILGSMVMINLVGIPEGADMTKYNYLRGNLAMLLISLAGVYVVSSFGEEVVYRGFLITRLQELLGGTGKLPAIGAIILSSVIFGFAHFEWGATGVVQTTCMGAALAISFLWNKRNLWPLILAHGCLDTLLLVQLYLAPESAS